MDCSYFRLRMNYHLDAELGCLEVAELQRHLEACPSCAAEFAEVGAVREAMAAWGRCGFAPPGLAQRVIAGVERELAAATARPLRSALDERYRQIDDLLGRVHLPGGRAIPVRSLLGWGLAAAAVLIGIERRHVRRARELRPS